MTPEFPFRHLEPVFFSGLLDDPVLLIRIKPTGRCLMFDCGQIHHLAKRNFTHLDAVFISHAHMDHWMGIDNVIRHLIATNRTIELFGPAGLIGKMEHKLAGYDWNLVEDYWCSFRVHEIHPQQIKRALFSGAKGFQRQDLPPLLRSERLIYQTAQCRVYAEICQHDIASIIYRVSEKPAFRIDTERLQACGLTPGPWLSALKRYYFAPPTAEGATEPTAERISVAPTHPFAGKDPRQLLRQLLIPMPAPALGYISDMEFSARNVETIRAFMGAVDLLFCECTYLAQDQERARRANHLCTQDVNKLLEYLQPQFFVPMHLSKSYRGNTGQLYAELSPPPATKLLKIPDLVTPKPLRMDELYWELAGKPV